MRAVLAVLPAAGVAGLVAAPERPALMLALLVLLLVFLLSCSKLAMDLVELSPGELAADAGALAAAVAGLTQISSAGRPLLGALLLLALAAQALPLALRRRSGA
jgi:hypothetical protein